MSQGTGLGGGWALNGVGMPHTGVAVAPVPMGVGLLAGDVLGVKAGVIVERQMGGVPVGGLPGGVGVPHP